MELSNERVTIPTMTELPPDVRGRPLPEPFAEAPPFPSPTPELELSAIAENIYTD